MNCRHTKTRMLLVVFTVLMSAVANSKEFAKFMPTAVKTAPPEYRWISTMSSGPADTSILDDSPDGLRGMFYRLAFVHNDDAFSRPIMRIDEIVYADAGCCWTVNKSWDVDFNKLEKSGVQMPPAEQSGIDSVVWLDAHTATIRYGASECTISDIGKATILAQCELLKAEPHRAPPPHRDREERQ
jgi:hypothetical protein